MFTINTSFNDRLKSLKEKFFTTYTPTEYTPTEYTPTEYTPTEYTPTDNLTPDPDPDLDPGLTPDLDSTLTNDIPPAPHTPPTYTYPNGNPIPFRSKKNPFNNGELYHSRDGKMYKAICRATMYDNEEEHYVMLQELNDTCEITKLPTLVLEDDFESGEMFEACNRFLS